jgi:Uma2 family endonuclease
MRSGGGKSRVDEDGFVAGSPELVADVSDTTASYDLHAKLNAYRRNGVLEYIVWRTFDGEIDWFVLVEGEYVRMQPDDSGRLESRVFPGLWLDPAALLGGDMTKVGAVLEEGLASAEHGEFLARLGSPKTR